jgi:DNA polymerase I-like protein with 3'-5' exonuclease and polymerase domains
LRLLDLEIGSDGRNRYYLAPFRTKTGRNAPSTTRSVFGAFKALRNLILAPEGYALAYCDWNSQEIGVAAALSGDEGLWLAYATGNPYLAFAKRIGRAPEGATKKTHKATHHLFKQVTLGLLYGMSSYGLARRVNISEAAADELVRCHRATYPRFWEWAECNIDRAALGLPLMTRFGWTLQYPPNSRAVMAPRTVLNFPMQANSAEMMRYAAIRGTEIGLTICCPVHDAFLIEAPIADIEDAAAMLGLLMGDASEAVLGTGYRITTDVEIARWPSAYREEEGLELFNILSGKSAQIAVGDLPPFLGATA